MNFIEELWGSLFNSEKGTGDKLDDTAAKKALPHEDSTCTRRRKTFWDHKRLTDLLEGRRFSISSKDKVGRNSQPTLGESIRHFNESRDLKTITCGSDPDIFRERLRTSDNSSSLKKSSDPNILRERLRTSDNRSGQKKSSAMNRLDIRDEHPKSEPTVRKSVSNSRSNGNLDNEKVSQKLSSDIVDDTTAEGDTEALQGEKEHAELSFMDIVRSNLQTLERNIVLMHRRQKKCSKRQSKAEFYRNKYKTDAAKRSNGTRSKLESSPEDKPKGVVRMLDTIQNRICGKDIRAETVSEIVRNKLEDHKRQFEGESRVQITSHFREKYAK